MQLNRRNLSGALACALLAALAACSDNATGPTDSSVDGKKTPQTPAVPSTETRPFYQGAYLGTANSTPERIAAAIREFGQLTGRQPSLVKTFHTMNCDFGAGGWCGQVLRAAATTGATNYVALDLRWTGAPATGLLEAINAGQADARITALAQGIRSVGSVVLLEPGWEMNGNWSYAWQGVLNGGDAAAPARYAAAWRRIVDIFRREGASNVRWVFNPNVGNAMTHSASGPSNWNWYGYYYPGDAYVDYVGAHGFNGPTVWNTKWQDFGTMTDGASADHMLSDLAARYPTKPIIIGEFATQEGAVWFNANKEADWRVESSTASLQAFQAAMAQPGVQTAFAPVAPSGNLLPGEGKLASN